MQYFDCHCDTLLEMYRKNKGFIGNGMDCDAALIAENDSADIVYAVFNDGSMLRSDILSVMDLYDSKRGELTNVTPHLAIEGLGNQADFCIDDIALYRSRGVEMISLTWNGDNILAGGIAGNKNGLTPLGRFAVSEMNRLGIIPDISHASDRTSIEVLEQSSAPVCAGHSNSRAVCPNMRNVSDEIFKLICKSGGVVGINFYAPFVSETNANIEAVIRHIEHFCALGGERNIGIGSDFDGIDKKTAGLENCGKLHNFCDALLAKGYNETFINRLLFENFREIFNKYE